MRCISTIIILTLSSSLLIGNANERKYVKEINSMREKLKEIKIKISKKNKEKNKAKTKEKSIINTLKKMNKKIARLKRDISKIKVDIKKANRKVKIAKKDLKTTLANLKITGNKLSVSMKTLYKIKKPNFYNAIISNKSISEEETIHTWAKQITEKEAKTYLELEKKHSIIAKKKTDLLKKLRLYTRLKKKNLNKYKKLKTEEKKKTKWLDEIRKKKKMSEQALKELKKGMENMQNLIELLRKEMQKFKDINKNKINVQKLKGELPWPVKGKITIPYGTYKHKEFNVKIFHQGITIKVKNRSSVKAIADGRVIYSDTMENYEHVVIIDHGNGFYSVTSNLSNTNIKLGERVKEKSIIGYVKEGSSIYFELRKNGKPLNPIKWLKK